MPKVIEADIAGVQIIQLGPFSDARGYFVETYRKEWLGKHKEMIQANRAERQAGSIVGLHFHPTQADYWYVASGQAQIILYDLRADSPTEGKTVVLEAGELPDGFKHLGVYIPAGVGHGFAAVTGLTLTYLVDSYYNPAEELGVIWDDPELSLPWAVKDPTLSERDRKHPRFSELRDQRPRYQP